MVFVLVHSPLVGPNAWSPVARELERRGHTTIVPSLRDVGTQPPPHWGWCVETVRGAVDAQDEPVILVGHSGSGLLLPAISTTISTPADRLIFVDSGVPAPTGETPLTPPAFLDQTRALAVGGMLPPWSTWFDETTMQELVPDDTLRAELEQEMPSLPLAMLEERIPSPPDWDKTPCAYLLLSDAYKGEADQALQRGWNVALIPAANHLHIAVAPGAVTDQLIDLAR